jgi:hypothetical protein
MRKAMKRAGRMWMVLVSGLVLAGFAGRSISGACGAAPAPCESVADSGMERQLIGGWKLECPFSRGMFAIDFGGKKLWLAGHTQTNEIWEYDLPEMGTGGEMSRWPGLKPVQKIAAWWPPAEKGHYHYANGLAFFRGKLWACPRVHYDQAPAAVTTLYARDGEKLVVRLPRQVFAGFVKVAGHEPLLGCGGYESGQGSAAGPSLATLEGQALIMPASFGAPGSQRELREANYWPKDHVDNWTALEPRRNAKGEREGRWATDWIYGGGLKLPEGYCYWPLMGTGEIDYKLQNETFSKTPKVYQYTYDPDTYKLKGWKEWTDGRVTGQEIDAAGRIYLSIHDAWNSGASPYQADPVIKVYGKP